MHLNIVGWIAKQVIRFIARVILRTEIEGMERIPRAGPVLVVLNHISFVDPFLLYVTLPRPLIGLGKAELWDHLITRVIARSWGTIPLHRGEMDLNAMKSAVQVLRDGGMLGIAPEGTRSHHGRTQQVKPGVALVATKVPEAVLVPVAVYGQEKLLWNLKHVRRTTVNMVIGEPFCLRRVTERVTHEVRQAISDEIMVHVVALLPRAYQGVYAGRSLEERYTTACAGRAARGEVTG